jgi:hypothetical protein
MNEQTGTELAITDGTVTIKAGAYKAVSVKLSK